MTSKATRVIAVIVIAVLTMMALCTAASYAASKKVYKIPVKIKGQDSTHKITYKGKTVKRTITGNGFEKFVFKGSNKYSFKGKSPYEGSSTYTMKRKSGRLVLLKGRNSAGDRITVKYYYKKGKLKKSITNQIFADDESYKKGKTVSTVKTDKYGNLKKVITKGKLTKQNGKLEQYTNKTVFSNKYKGGSLYRSSMSYYTKTGKHWSKTFADARTFSYKKVKLSKKQYNKYRPIIDYMVRNSMAF